MRGSDVGTRAPEIGMENGEEFQRCVFFWGGGREAHCCGLPGIQSCGQVHGGSDYHFTVHKLVIWGLLLAEMDQ